MGIGKTIKALIKENELTASDCSDIFVALLQKPQVLGGKLWTTDDLYTLLSDRGLSEKDAENIVGDATNYVYRDILCDCEDYEWEELIEALNKAAKEVVT